MTVAAATLFGAGTGVAVAVNVFYTPGAVGANRMWADGTRHSYTYAYTSTDHTGCAGVANVGGGIYSGGYTFWNAGCTNGSGTVSGSVSPGRLVYGAVLNPNNATTDHFGSSYARY